MERNGGEKVWPGSAVGGRLNRLEIELLVRRREVEAASTLEVLAEIAIAIAGFSGVIAALTIRTSQWSELDKIRLRMLLQASFATVFFSLLPLVLLSTTLLDPAVWVIASSAWLIYMGASTIPFVVRAIRSTPDGIGRPILALFVGVVGSVVVVQVLNVAVLRTAWPHLAAMLSGLFAASVAFIRLIQSLIYGGSRAA